MSLKEVDQGFTDLVFSSSKYLEDQLVGDLPLEVKRGMRIYQVNNRGALVNAVKSIYPLSETLIGESAFQNILDHYLYQNPMKSSDLNLYGLNLADYVEKLCQPEGALSEMPYLVDLMRIESALHNLYYNGEESGEAQNGFRISSEYNVYDLYQWLKSGAQGSFDLGAGQMVSFSNGSLFPEVKLVSDTNE